MILRRKYSSNRGMSGQIACSDIAVPIKWLLPARTPADPWPDVIRQELPQTGHRFD
jgi:hypothetical protein